MDSKQVLFIMSNIVGMMIAAAVIMKLTRRFTIKQLIISAVIIIIDAIVATYGDPACIFLRLIFFAILAIDYNRIDRGKYGKSS